MVNRLVNDPLDSVLFATDQKTFDDTVSALKVSNFQYLHISFYEPAPRTLSEAKQLVDRGKAMVADVEADLRAQGLGGVLVSQVPFDRSTQIATQAQSNVAVSILPLAAIALLGAGLHACSKPGSPTSTAANDAAFADFVPADAVVSLAVPDVKRARAAWTVPQASQATTR